MTAYAASVALGGLAGYCYLSAPPTVATLATSLLAAVVGGFAYALLEVRTGGRRIQARPVWIGAVATFALACGAVVHLLGADTAPDQPEPSYPPMVEMLDLKHASADELALLYQMRWHMQNQRVPEQEAISFFRDVVGGLRQAPAEQRLLALKHLLANLSPDAAKRLGIKGEDVGRAQEGSPYRGFLPPPPGSCGGVCGKSPAASTCGSCGGSCGSSCGGTGGAAPVASCGGSGGS